MNIILRKDKVIRGSVWLIDSITDVPDDEAKKLIDQGDANLVEELSPEDGGIFLEMRPPDVAVSKTKGKKRKTE